MALGKNDRRFFIETRWALALGFLASTAMATAGPRRLPVLNQPVADRAGLAGFPLTVDLASVFGTEAIDDQVVRFTSQFNSGGAPVVMDMALFSDRTPVTRQNFLNYVLNGAYENSFIHRSVPGFVIQGGAYTLTGNDILSVPTAAPILNEFGVSNTLGTVSMAKLGGNPNSATSQWFVSLGANSNILDPQNGGFTVFGRMTRSTFGNAQLFGNPGVFPIYDYRGSLGSAFGELPLLAPGGELVLFPSVALVPLPAGEAGEDPTLTYSVVSNSQPGIATASLQAATLSLSPVAGQTGTTVVTVRATDSVGNRVEDSFSLTVNLTDTFATWASRNDFPGGQNTSAQNPDGDAWNNLQEYAFLGDPEAASHAVFAGTTGTAPLNHQTIRFPLRKFTRGLSYAVEAGDGEVGNWVEIWNSADGIVHPLVVSTLDQGDRTEVTVKDSIALGDQPKRFMRVKVVQQ